MKQDEPKQADPFSEDPTKTVIEDPIAGVVTSDEWKNPETLQQCPIDDPRAAHWQEHAYDQAYDIRWQTNVCIELARFAVPPGSQGRVSIIETAILGYDGEGNPIGGFGEFWPFFYDMVNGYDTPIALAWYLRLESWRREGLELPSLLTTTEDQLPGVPHPALGEWHDARYDYARKNVHTSIFVPEGHYLRLFGQIRARNFTWLQRLWDASPALLKRTATTRVQR